MTVPVVRSPLVSVARPMRAPPAAPTIRPVVPFERRHRPKHAVIMDVEATTAVRQARGFAIALWSSSKKRGGRFSSSCSNPHGPASLRSSNGEAAAWTTSHSQVVLIGLITSVPVNMLG